MTTFRMQASGAGFQVLDGDEVLATLRHADGKGSAVARRVQLALATLFPPDDPSITERLRQAELELEQLRPLAHGNAGQSAEYWHRDSVRRQRQIEAEREAYNKIIRDAREALGAGEHESIVDAAARLRAALNVDQSGLAQALFSIVGRVEGSRWIAAGESGSYDQGEPAEPWLRREVGWLIDSVKDAATDALRFSGNVAAAALGSGPLFDAERDAARRVLSAERAVVEAVAEYDRAYDGGAVCQQPCGHSMCPVLRASRALRAARKET